MSPAAATSLERLARIVGAENLQKDPAQLVLFEIDGTRAAAVARPANPAQVAEVVRFAAAENLALVPCGARTKIGIGMPPARYDLALDMTRLDHIVAFDPDDLTLSVEAGMKLADLAAVLAEHKQMLPLAVPFTSLTTVGGTISSGIDSPLRHSYGTARDYVLGMEFVPGDGQAVKSGGRVVKNVAGYDLHKLMIGSLGTLGVITRVNFRTFPLPPASRGFLATFPHVESAMELRGRIVRSPLHPLTIEIISPELAHLFMQRAPKFLGAEIAPPGAWFRTSEWIMAAGFGGNAQMLARYEKDLTQMAAETRATSSVVLDDNDRPLVWGRLRECLPLMLDGSAATTVVKISLPANRLGELLGRARAAAESRAIQHASLARAAGVVYFALFAGDTSEASLSSLESACNDLFALAHDTTGRATILFCPAALKRRVNVWGPPGGDFALMKNLKQTFDPHNILSPGRFIGGL